MLVGGALAQSDALVREMQVFPQKMRADLEITHGLIMAEAVTLALAAFIGKADAHHRIEALCRRRSTNPARRRRCWRTTRWSASIFRHPV